MRFAMDWDKDRAPLVLSAISADIFHGKHFGAIFGYFTFSIGLGGAIGGWFGGFLFDITHH